MEWDFTRQYVATLVFGTTGFSSQELSGTTTNGAGTAGTGSVSGGIPKQRATINLNWTYGDWSASCERRRSEQLQINGLLHQNEESSVIYSTRRQSPT